MSSRLDSTGEQVARPPFLSALQEELWGDERLETSYQPVTSQKIRAEEILEVLCERHAFPRVDRTGMESSWISAPRLAEMDRFDVGTATLRSDLKTLVEYGYLEADTTGSPYVYRIADSCVDGVAEGTDTETAERMDTETADESPQPPATDTSDSTEMTHVQSPTQPRTYHQIAALIEQANANLTPAQRTVASGFGTGGVVVGLFGVILAVGILSTDPHLVAAGAASLKAGVTMLIGWVWLHFVGFVDGMSDDHDNALSPTAPE